MTKESNQSNDWKVYVHTCLETGWKYVGITSEIYLETRWRNGNGYRHNPHFYNAIKKYGWHNFDHDIIDDGLTKEEANTLEEHYIKKYREQGICYNITSGGEGHNGESLSEETKKKISATLKAKKMVPWNKGKTGVYSEETLKKISESGKGRPGWNKGLKLGPMPEETRQKISRANKGKNTWSKGSVRGPYSEEHRKNISEGLKGKRLGIPLGPRPDDVKAKIGAGRKGLKWICKPWENPTQVHKEDLDRYLNDGWSLGKQIVLEGKVYKWDAKNKQWIKKGARN